MPGLFPPQRLDPVPTHTRKGFLSEKAASTWHSPDSGLAQSTTRPRFKATHALESKQGETLVSECTGAFCGWPFHPGPRMAFVPSILGDCSPSVTMMLHNDYHHILGPFLLLPFYRCKILATATILSEGQLKPPTVRQPYGAEVARVYPVRA